MMSAKRNCIRYIIVFFVGLGLGPLLSEAQRLRRIWEFFAISKSISTKLIGLHDRPPPGVSQHDWSGAVAVTTNVCSNAFNSPYRLSTEALLKLRTDLIQLIDHEPSSGDLLIRIWWRVGQTSDINFEWCNRAFPLLEDWLVLMKGGTEYKGSGLFNRTRRQRVLTRMALDLL